ncbi:MAG: MarR family transcriptional regulator [Nitrosomonas sp.]|nr:MarR family transcriptional regulator [Nitrosomonas sp.]
MSNFQYSRYKFKYAHLLTPAGIAAKTVLAGQFLKRKIAEYEALKAEIKTLRSELSGELVLEEQANHWKNRNHD